MNKWLWMLLPAAVVCGCAMLGAWKAIPPPGGCDQCHSVPINANWEVRATAVTLASESGREPWQKEASVLPPDIPPIQIQKVEGEPCFRCHKGPSRAHTERLGRYHH
ncbi:cytochrome C [Syntrophotalea acetylenica]|jgi:hypothetical protein|uniref:cytochrome C n=1 Tax=Syntrophotalea TaxID=2812025 RepID=UPI002A37124F|nr:cytochrome C [Syntrophotalea acetylenica]MDY0261345.1 cytochrome C [Syntrophotalea acetylenica]